MKGEGRNACCRATGNNARCITPGGCKGSGFAIRSGRWRAGSTSTGFVRNLPDGRVHLVVEGATAEIDKFLDAVKAEMGYYIGEIQETERPATGRFPSFEIRH